MAGVYIIAHVLRAHSFFVTKAFPSHYPGLTFRLDRIPLQASPILYKQFKSNQLDEELVLGGR